MLLVARLHRLVAGVGAATDGTLSSACATVSSGQGASDHRVGTQGCRTALHCHSAGLREAVSDQASAC